MRKIKKLYRSILCIGTALFFHGCANMLDFPPENTETSNEFYANIDDVSLQNLAAIYNQLYSGYVHGFSFMGATEIISDNADKGSDPSDTGRDKHLMDALQLDSYNESYNELWMGYYEGITKVNKFLGKINEFNNSNEDKDRLEGEVKFLRAYFYFNLVRWFGDVPKVTLAPDDDMSPEAMKKARTRVKQKIIYDFIIEDLKRAIATCPSKAELSPNEVGRATSTAAKGLLAKVYLYTQEWQKCYDLTMEVEADGVDLYPNYEELFREKGENCIESLFEVQCKGTQPALGIEGYYQIQAPRPSIGWGFNTPSQNLLDSYAEGDIRKEATVMYRGETLWDGYTVPEESTNVTYNQKAYVSPTQESYAGDQWITNKNLRILRFGEILLIRAEAAARLGQSAGLGLEALNRVRERAHLDPYTTLTVEEVWQERRWELAFEHDRWFDLIRSKQAPKAMQEDGKVWNNKLWYAPIPQTQIDLSGGILTQNSGY